MANNDFLFSRIGMALVSAQRVEYVTGQLLELLIEFDRDVYGITSAEFLNSPQKQKAKARKTLGDIFRLFKLNPKLVLEDQLDNYLEKRNILAHEFFKRYLTPVSLEKEKEAIEFLYDFGQLSTKLESFFKGFIYFLALRHVPDRSQMDIGIKEFEKDFEYFMNALDQKNL